RTALVTGASSGIGVALARQLAARGANLVLTARRKDRLDALAEELRTAHGVDVTTVALDLGRPTGPLSLYEATEGAGRPVDILVNNAGFGTQERFARIPWEKSAEQIQLNIVSLTELTRRFLAPMLERGRGHILNVASIGAYMPVPCFATYAAGKAYVRNFTEALASELAGTPVRACCLCPGGTRTEFLEVAGQKATWLVDLALMSPERCARIGLRALFGHRRNIVAGFLYSFMCWSLRFVPRRLAVWLAGLVMGKRE
ncbi:MAG: SDR family oxidoreductase, partial [Polyangiaceae bacterium]|nr:SDR family oxidoreductase [Polyangiaceae bacterium]